MVGHSELMVLSAEVWLAADSHVFWSIRVILKERRDEDQEDVYQFHGWSHYCVRVSVFQL